MKKNVILISVSILLLGLATYRIITNWGSPTTVTIEDANFYIVCDACQEKTQVESNYVNKPAPENQIITEMREVFYRCPTCKEMTGRHLVEMK